MICDNNAVNVGCYGNKNVWEGHEANVYFSDWASAPNCSGPKLV